MSDDLDYMFSHSFYIKRPSLAMQEQAWRPAADVFETEDQVVVIIDIASISEKDLSIALENDTLIVRGIRRELSGFRKRHYHKMEIDFGPFERVIKLPCLVADKEVKAKYKNGFLEIRLQKMISERCEIKIQIK